MALIEESIKIKNKTYKRTGVIQESSSALEKMASKYFADMDDADNGWRADASSSAISELENILKIASDGRKLRYSSKNGDDGYEGKGFGKKIDVQVNRYVKAIGWYEKGRIAIGLLSTGEPYNLGLYD